GVSGDWSRCVAGGGTGEFAQSVVASHGDGKRKPAGLERARWIRALFLEENARVTSAMQHRGPALTQRDGLRFRKHRAIAPHSGPRRCGSLPGNIIAGGRAAQSTKIVP